MNEPLLPDKVVLVTGSTMGIGEAVARRCVAEGARVMIHGLEADRAVRLCRELGDASAYVVADLAEAASPAHVVAAVIERFGRIDGLVNNAAVTTRSTLESTDAAVFDRIIAINLRAPLLLIQAAMPHFRRQGGGAVVNVGSVNALGGERNLLAYSVSKGGLLTMTRNLADAHGPDRVRINQINAGWTLTENERRLKQEEGLPEGWETRLPATFAPFGRIFFPEEVAGHVVYWLSDRAGPVSGSVFELEQHPFVGRNPHKEM
jgi:NAD(P)-dependent dehydrogenase (short-subunit alcohol dehydrogenase family)